MNKKSDSIELKSILDVIIKQFREIMTLKPFKGKVDHFLNEEYLSGMIKAEDEIKPTINFIPSHKNMDFLNQYVFDNLQAHSDEVGNKLRQEISRGLMEKEGVKELKKRIKDVFKDKVYTNRMKTVIRTEKQRANNAGVYDGALQAQDAGIKLKKWLDVTLDSRTTNCCRVGNSKYGSPDKAIPLDKEFVMKIHNKTYRAQYPPMLPNCRSVLRIVRIKE